MQCEYCAHYVFDEIEQYYYCDIDLDEDELYRFLQGHEDACPYYQSGDEYEIVRHQI